MGGFLIPSWYEPEEPSWLSLTLVTFLFGFSSACAAFTAVTIIHQARRARRRTKNLIAHPYVVMISVEWASSVVISVISFLFVIDVIPPSFWLFFGILCLWVLQIQCIMHIIINRIALIMYDARQVRKLKVGATLLIGAINITVFVIWIPARLQISPYWVQLNSVWDRVEKGIFAIFDLGLNLYFIHLVRSELTAHGLTKYRYLYLFNLGMVFISISLDIILIGIMSLPRESSFIYVQFHPLMYLIKLKIEMNMADLIVKIVKATSPPPGHELHRYAGSDIFGPHHPGSQYHHQRHHSPRPTRASRHASDDLTKKTSATVAPSGSSTLCSCCGCNNHSQMNILASSPTTTTATTATTATATTPTTLNNNSSSNSNNNTTAGAAETASQPSPSSPPPRPVTWELGSKMPRAFDVNDVVDARRASMAAGAGGGGGGGGGGVSAATLAMHGFAPMRPAFVRNMSEMTALEMDAGYLNPSSKKKRMSLVNQPPSFGDSP